MTRRQAEHLARAFYDRDQAAGEWEMDRGRGGDYEDDPDDRDWEWERDPDWEPPGGWQEPEEIAEALSYMTHEERIEWFEWLAEELDVTISDIFEMMGSP